MRWLRLYDDTINDPKVLKLPEATRWHWIALLCVASKNEGILPPIDDISIQLRVTPAKATEIIAILVRATLLDKTETGFAPHNWSGRQYKSDVTDPTNAQRQKRYRDKARNGTVTDIETVTVVTDKRPDTDTDTDTEPEKKETRASALADGWPPDFRDQFWSRYPNKVGKPKALAKLEQCMRRGIEWPAIEAGLDAYIRTKPPDRAWLNPETFINQERWTDQPAEVTNGRRTVHDAAKELSRNLAALDEPAPRVCEPAGGSPLRLLPSR